MFDAHRIFVMTRCCADALMCPMRQIGSKF